MKKWKTVIGNMSIRRKLIITTISLILIPTSIMTILFNIYARKMIDRNEDTYQKESLNQMVINLDNKISLLENVLMDISTDSIIQSNLETLNTELLSDYEKSTIIREMKDQIIYQAIKINEIQSVYLYADHGAPIRVSKELTIYTEEVPMDQIRNAKGGNVWGKQITEGILPIYKQVNSLKGQNQIGVMGVYLSDDYLYQIFDEIKENNGVECYLVDSEWNSIEDPNNNEWKKKRIGESEKGYFDLLDRNEKVYYQKLTNNDWTLLYKTDRNSMSIEVVTLHNLTILLFMILTGMLIFVCIILSDSLAKPIIELTSYMNQFSKGNFEISVTAKYNDEIGQLRRKFNNMVSDTEKLIKSLFETEKLKQEAQLKALQMQISPHFFYNTMDTIRWLAASRGADDIVRVSQAFAKLMRYSLKECDFVSFEEELDAIDQYRIIQECRYGNSLTLDEEIEEDIFYEYMPKNILFPIIENAIEHGLQNKEAERKLIIRGKIKENNICVDVFDNGIGMDENKVKEILSVEDSVKAAGHMSIGVQNVNNRLILLYGKEYGLTISSKKNVGTVVSIRIPLSEERLY